MNKNLKKRSKKGFTLIELVVVIAILGILAAILVPVISGFIETANQATDNANARLVYQAAAMWFAANSPSATTALTCSSGTEATNISTYLGLTAFPVTRSVLFNSGASFTASVTSAGEITVTAGAGVSYDPATGKLVKSTS